MRVWLLSSSAMTCLLPSDTKVNWVLAIELLTEGLSDSERAFFSFAIPTSHLMPR